VTPDDTVRTLSIKGSATPDAVASALMSTPERVKPTLDRLVRDGLAEREANMFRLTRSGKSKAKQLLAADQVRCGVSNAVAALDAFLALDKRAKETVTAWQLREEGGAQILNDHTDDRYDARVLNRLASLHRDAKELLALVGKTLDRFRLYTARLDRALTCARDGDGRFVASPQVDSYHSVWFELHEDLILLAGRNRADETAAGRA
jgi:DNA-binding MarR family transcriptional regulator